MRRTTIALYVVGAYAASFEMLKFALSGIDPRHRGLESWHASMLAGTQGAPNVYRVLTPWIAELLHRFGASLFLAYGVIHFAGYLGWAFALDRVWKSILSETERIAGVLLVMLCTALAYVPVVQPTEPLNALFFALAAWLLCERNWRALIVVGVLASLNKQTAVFIGPLILFHELLDEPWHRALLRAAIVSAAILIVQVVLIRWIGRRDYYTELWQYETNVLWMKSNLAGWSFVWMAVAPMILIFATWRVQPRIARAFALTTPLFVIGHFAIAIVSEVRIFIPLLAGLVPGVLVLQRQRSPSP